MGNSNLHIVPCRAEIGYFYILKQKRDGGGGSTYILLPHFQLDREFVTSGTVTTHPPFSPPGSNQIKKELCCSLAAFSERRCFSLFCFVLFCVWFLSLWLLRFLRPRVDDVRVDGGERLTVGSDLRWMSRAWLRSTQPPTTTVHTPGVYSLWLYCAARVCVSLSIQWTNNIVDVLRHPIFSMWLYTIKTSGSWSLE